MDPLSLSLSSLRVATAAIVDCRFSGDWSLRYEDLRRPYCVTVLAGRCWYEQPGQRPQQLTAGDVLMVLQPVVSHWSSAPGLRGPPLAQLMRERGVQEPDGSFNEPITLRIDGPGRGDPVRYLAIGFQFREEVPHPVLGLLPGVLRLPGPLGQTVLSLHTAIERVLEEIHPGPGYSAIAHALAEAALLMILREYLLTQLDSSDRLASVLHPQIGRALEALHRAPERPWTVASLAAEASMSRATFAREFQRLMHRSPIRYLTDWRVALAKDWLRGTNRSLDGVAAALGFGTPERLRAAFSRHAGMTPAAYRRSLGKPRPKGDEPREI